MRKKRGVSNAFQEKAANEEKALLTLDGGDIFAEEKPSEGKRRKKTLWVNFTPRKCYREGIKRKRRRRERKREKQQRELPIAGG